jgi:hypothetical protein
MSGYAVAQIDEVDELNDGRVPWRPIRFHFGITSFGVNAFTAHQVGDRLINEHDESQEHDLQEELYLVQRGRATFELGCLPLAGRAGGPRRLWPVLLVGRCGWGRRSQRRARAFRLSEAGSTRGPDGGDEMALWGDRRETHFASESASTTFAVECALRRSASRWRRRFSRR